MTINPFNNELYSPDNDLVLVRDGGSRKVIQAKVRGSAHNSFEVTAAGEVSTGDGSEAPTPLSEQFGTSLPLQAEVPLDGGGENTTIIETTAADNDSPVGSIQVRHTDVDNAEIEVVAGPPTNNSARASLYAYSSPTFIETMLAAGGDAYIDLGWEPGSPANAYMNVNVGGQGSIQIGAGSQERIGFCGATPVLQPEIPASPTVQDVVDALVALGLVTQAS